MESKRVGPHGRVLLVGFIYLLGEHQWNVNFTTDGCGLVYTKDRAREYYA